MMMDRTHEEGEYDLVSLTFLILVSPWTIRRGDKARFGDFPVMDYTRR